MRAALGALIALLASPLWSAPPALRAGAFLPQRLSGTVFCYIPAASRYTVTTAGLITAWADSSLAENHAAGSGTNPALLSSLDFNSTGERMVVSLPSDVTQPYTYACLVRSRSDSPTKGTSMYLWGRDSLTGFWVVTSDRSIKIQSGSGSPVTAPAGSAPDDAWLAILLEVNGAATTCTVNGVTTTAAGTPGTGGIAAGASLKLGSSYVGGNAYIGVVAYQQLIQGALSAEAKAKLRNWMAGLQASLHRVTDHVELDAGDAYRAFPGLAKDSVTGYIVTYRKGTAHVDQGSLYYRASTDGVTWGAETPIYTDASSPDPLDVRGGGVYIVPSGTYAGRIVWSGAVSDAYLNGGTTMALTHAIVLYSDDHGATWTGPVSIASSLTWSFCESHVLQLSDGRLAIVYYGADPALSGRQVCRISFSSDGGATWTGDVMVASVSGVNLTEPCIVYASNGTTLVVLARSPTYYIYRVTSTEPDTTWGTPTATNGMSNGAPKAWRATDGSLITIARSITGYGVAAGQAVILRSTDDGATWSMPYNAQSGRFNPSRCTSGMDYGAGIVDGTSHAIAWSLEPGPANIARIRFVKGIQLSELQ